jgi:hypothetical protein
MLDRSRKLKLTHYQRLGHSRNASAPFTKTSLDSRKTSAPSSDALVDRTEALAQSSDALVDATEAWVRWTEAFLDSPEALDESRSALLRVYRSCITYQAPLHDVRSPTSKRAVLPSMAKFSRE